MGDCQDEDPTKCQIWVGWDSNECERNSVYMHAHCAKSCNACPKNQIRERQNDDEDDEDNDNDNDNGRIYCQDQHPAGCQIWVGWDTNECERNAVYMQTHCANSCKKMEQKKEQEQKEQEQKQKEQEQKQTEQQIYQKCIYEGGDGDDDTDDDNGRRTRRTRRKSTSNKIQLGVVSATLDRGHSVSEDFGGILQRLDRNIFNVTYIYIHEKEEIPHYAPFLTANNNKTIVDGLYHYS